METNTKNRPDVIRAKIASGIKDDATNAISDLVNNIIDLAYQLKASDIHIDPQADFVRVRLRTDGVLQDEPSLPKEVHTKLVSRLKILATLPIDGYQTPRDGRFKVELETGSVDVRI